MSKFIVLVFIVLLAINYVSAQSTEFVYQGSLKDGASLANGNYDFEFALFDALTAGNQLGSTLSRNSIGVTNGSFSAKLDFGSQFPGANRFLEVRVRLTGQPNITTLARLGSRSQTLRTRFEPSVPPTQISPLTLLMRLPRQIRCSSAAWQQTNTLCRPTHDLAMLEFPPLEAAATFRTVRHNRQRAISISAEAEQFAEQ